LAGADVSLRVTAGALEDLRDGGQVYTAGAGLNLSANQFSLANNFATDVTFSADIITATAGTSNFRAGFDAGTNLASGSTGNTFVGDNAGKDTTTGDNNVAVGKGALENNTTAVANVAVGMEALLRNTTGQSNSAIGFRTLSSNTTGSNNMGIGQATLRYSTTGNNNLAIGVQSLFRNTTGTSNVGLGLHALYNNVTSNYNTASGTQALKFTTAADNTAMGGQAGMGVTSGTLNSFFGRSSGSLVTTGSRNTILGAFDGNENGLDIRTSSNNIVLSDGAGNPRLSINSSGAATFASTVNGRDVAADGAKLDDIAAGANNYTLPSGYATEGFVSNQITALVDSSPATLNTLNELAAALGDDPNFATTVTNNIGTKLSLAGGTVTGNLSVTGTTTSGKLILGSNTVGTTSDIALTANAAINAVNSLSFGMTDNTGSYFRWMFGNTSNTGGTAGGVEKMKLDPSGNLTLSGTVDGVDIAARDAVLTSTKTTADAALANDGTSTGNYSTSGQVQSGRGSGGVALTINDGYGNANVTFNHLGGVPEQTGNAARIEFNADSASNPTMTFELGTGTAGAAFQTPTILTLNSTGATVTGTLSATGGNSTNWNTAYGWGDHADYGLGISGFLEYPKSSIDDASCPAGSYRAINTNPSSGTRPAGLSLYGYIQVYSYASTEKMQVFTDVNGDSATRLLKSGGNTAWKYRYNSQGRSAPSNDADDAIEGGMYRVTSTTSNTPLSATGTITVSRSYGVVSQVWTNGTTFQFRRSTDTGATYNAWKEFLHDGNFDPADYLPLTGGSLTGALKLGGQIMNSAATLQVNGFQRTGSIFLHEGGTSPTTVNKELQNGSGYLKWDNYQVWTSEHMDSPSSYGLNTTSAPYITDLTVSLVSGFYRGRGDLITGSPDAWAYNATIQVMGSSALHAYGMVFIYTRSSPSQPKIWFGIRAGATGTITWKEIAQAAKYLPLTGGTMTGQLNVQHSGTDSINLRKTADTSYNGLTWSDAAGASRWLLYQTNNAQGDLSLQGRRANGAYQHTTFVINNNTGVVDFRIQPTLNGSALLSAATVPSLRNQTDVPSTTWNNHPEVINVYDNALLGSEGGFKTSWVWNGYRNNAGGFTYRGVNSNTTTASNLEHDSSGLYWRAGVASGTTLPLKFSVASDGDMTLTGGITAGGDSTITGDLTVQNTDGLLTIRDNTNGGANAAYKLAFDDASNVERGSISSVLGSDTLLVDSLGSVALRYAGVDKITTNASGASILGNVDADIYTGDAYKTANSILGNNYINNGAGTANHITWDNGAAVNLYYNGVNKLQTTSIGTTAYGSSRATDGATASYIDFAGLYTNRSLSYIRNTHATGSFYVNANNSIRFRTIAGLDTLVLTMATQKATFYGDVDVAGDIKEDGTLLSAKYARLGSANNYSNTSGLQRFNTQASSLIEGTSSVSHGLEVLAQAGSDAFMQFHISGDYAVKFGLDGSTNKLAVGGWSMGANAYAIYHEGNKPALDDLTGTAADSALLGGVSPSVSDVVSTIVKRGTTGDVHTRLFRSTHGNASSVTAGAAIMMRVNNSTDNYLRPITQAGFRAEVTDGVYEPVNTIPTSGDWWSGGYSKVNTDGTHEIGKYIDFHSTSSTTADNTYRMTNTASGQMSFSGSLTAAGNITAYSDERLKKGIETIPNALDKVSQLKGVTFTDIATEEKRTGLIAQDVQRVLPEAVMQPEGQEHLAIAYGNTVGLLVEAIKELKAEVDELKSQLENK